MSIKDTIKNNDFLRLFVKRQKNTLEYLHDATEYSSYYLEAAERSGNHRYRIMLLVHSIEKGMCMSPLRPFGKKKALQLKSILEETGRKAGMEFEYDLGISTLYAWTAFFDEMEWKKNDVVLSVQSFLEGKSVVYKAGRKEYLYPHSAIEQENFTEIMLSRHSVRDFEERDIKEEDLDYAIQMFVEAPTACNRQMCKIYLVKNRTVVELLNNTVLGVSGFNKKTINYFIITYDMAAFDFFGERNQGYLNAGLVAMNFANGLHAKGIGSCFMQWANKRSEDEMVRKALGLAKSERIAVVLGAGYYKEKSYIPSSIRRNTKDVFSIVV